MGRFITPMDSQHLDESARFVQDVFADAEGRKSAQTVQQLVLEIRSKRFHLEGRYENELLLLAPVVVKTDCQRQHVSKDIIEFGFHRAVEMGFKAVIVEGDPQNYKARGFRTSRDLGIVAGKTVALPSPECLMVKELVDGALLHISGIVEYSDYQYLI